MDRYQEAYLKHQDRKKRMLEGEIEDGEKNQHDAVEFMTLVESRTSQRMFSKERISENELNYIKKVIVNTPSSCNRQAVQVMLVENKERKERLQELLVGGANWISKADIIILLLADMEAYKSPAEVDFMPYLDAGFIGMSIYYACEAIELGCCFVNPNIRDENKETFKTEFSGDFRMCGAIAIGKYDKKSISIKKRNDIFIK